MAFINDMSTFAPLDDGMDMQYNSYPSYTMNNETKPFETQPTVNDIGIKQNSVPISHISNNEAKRSQHSNENAVIHDRRNGGGAPPKLPKKGALKEHFEPNTEESQSLNMAQLSELSEQLKHLNELNDKNIKSSQSFFDLYGTKKKEIMKFFCFALVLVVGLSLNKIVEDYYIDDYLVDLDTSYSNKVLLRLAYPALVLFLLWTIKVYS